MVAGTDSDYMLFLLGLIFVMYLYYKVAHKPFGELNLFRPPADDYSRIFAWVSVRRPAISSSEASIGSVKLQMDELYREEIAKGIPEKSLRGFKAFIEAFDVKERDELIKYKAGGKASEGNEDVIMVNGKPYKPR